MKNSNANLKKEIVKRKNCHKYVIKLEGKRLRSQPGTDARHRNPHVTPSHSADRLITCINY